MKIFIASMIALSMSSVAVAAPKPMTDTQLAKVTAGSLVKNVKVNNVRLANNIKIKL